MKQSNPEEKERQRRLLLCLGESNWEDMTNALLLHVVTKYSWMRHDHSLCEEIVQEAIVRTLKCTRQINWSFEGYTDNVELIWEDVFCHLCGAVRSLISHRYKKEFRTVYFDLLQDENASSTPGGLAFRIPTTSETPEDFARYRELAEQVIIAANATRDKFTRTVAEAWILNPGLSPKEVASEMEADIKDVQNAKKRLRRQFLKLLSLKDKKRSRAKLNIFPKWSHNE